MKTTKIVTYMLQPWFKLKNETEEYQMNQEESHPAKKNRAKKNSLGFSDLARKNRNPGLL